MVIDDKDRLSIFDKNSPYLATKKIGKNNPKAEEIKADNKIRMEWNRTVDRAIVSCVPNTEIVELKKVEITDRVKESVRQNGNKPELFGDIVRAAIVLLEMLIAKVMRKVMDLAEKVIDKAVDAVKETPKEIEIHVHAEDKPTHQPERKKIPFPINPHRKSDVQKDTEHPTIAPKERENIIRQIKAEPKPVHVETGQTAGRPPQPQLSVLAAKYPRLKEIEGRLKEQNKAIFGREKKRLSAIVKEYKFDSVQAFYKELNAAKSENLEYQAARVKYEKIYGDKAADSMSVRDRLRQKEQIVKIRETGRAHQARQKDKGTR